jgi:hypothetical protein
MRHWFLKVLLTAAAAAVIGCSQSACQSSRSEDASGDWPYQGPLTDEAGQVVEPPQWEMDQ